MVYDSVYINFKHRQNHFYSEKVKILFILDYLWGRHGWSDYKRASGVLCCCLVTESCSNLCDPMDCIPPRSFVPGSLQARILECHFLLQGIFLTGSNPCILHWQADSLPLNHLGSPSNIQYFDLGYGYSLITRVLYSLTYFYPITHIFTE